MCECDLSVRASFGECEGLSGCMCECEGACDSVRGECEGAFESVEGGVSGCICECDLSPLGFVIWGSGVGQAGFVSWRVGFLCLVGCVAVWGIEIWHWKLFWVWEG